MNYLSATSDGDLQVFSDGNDVKLTDAEKLRLFTLQSESANTDYAIGFLQTEIRKAEIELQKDEKYLKLIRLKSKLQMARKQKNGILSVMNYEYKNIFKNQNMGDAEIMNGVNRYIPDAPKKTGKRGRPRKELV